MMKKTERRIVIIVKEDEGTQPYSVSSVVVCWAARRRMKDERVGELSSCGKGVLD